MKHQTMWSLLEIFENKLHYVVENPSQETEEKSHFRFTIRNYLEGFKELGKTFTPLEWSHF